ALVADSCYNKSPDAGSIDPADIATGNIYQFSSQITATMPAGCLYTDTVDGIEEYTCGVPLTLAVYDSIVIDEGSSANITFAGALTTGISNSFNAGGDASNLNIHTLGALTINDSSVINGNVSSVGAIVIGTSVLLNGNLSASTPAGVITTNTGSRITGSVFTTDGAITLGAGAIVGSDVSSDAGVLTLLAGALTYEVTSGAGAITIYAGSHICRNVTSTGAGVISLTGVAVGRSLSSVAGAITGVTGTTVGKDVTITGAGVATFTASEIGGNISTIAAPVLTTTLVGGLINGVPQ
ncbi:MAG: hypothetical protein ACI85U_001358, partial [Candidatus Promineifilaceae bacterium]